MAYGCAAWKLGLVDAGSGLAGMSDRANKPAGSAWIFGMCGRYLRPYQGQCEGVKPEVAGNQRPGDSPLFRLRKPPVEDPQTSRSLETQDVAAGG
jgi:hypothetical protein